jgi:hypothetical protein
MALAVPLAELTTEVTTTDKAGALTASATEIVCGLLDVPLAVTETLPLYVPDGSPAGFTDTVSALEVVETWSHAVFEAADQVSELELETVIVCGAGTVFPEMYENWSCVAERVMVCVGGVGAITASETDTVFGVFVAPAAVTVTVPVYEPADKPPGLTATVSVEGAVPAGAESTSHAALDLADQERVLLPGLVIATDCGAGRAPPLV